MDIFCKHLRHISPSPPGLGEQRQQGVGRGRRQGSRGVPGSRCGSSRLGQGTVHPPSLTRTLQPEEQ